MSIYAQYLQKKKTFFSGHTVLVSAQKKTFKFSDIVDTTQHLHTHTITFG